MILDTCALLFLAKGDRRLSSSARERLSKESLRCYCAISTFEIALKYEQRKLALPLPPLRWMEALGRRYVLTEIPIDSALCAAAAALPSHHRDPFDRFIIAAAKRLECAVVTVDERFSAYGVEIVT